MTRARGLRALGLAAAALLALAVSGCGGGGGGSSAPPAPSAPPLVGANQLLVTIENNPAVTAVAPTVATVNIPYVTVTVCNASAQCTSIDHVVLDTGSYGLRLLQSALGGLSLPADSTGAGDALGECARFLGGYIWGSVAHATLRLAGETTASLPVQVIAPSGFPAAPSTCASLGTDVGTLTGLQGNGLLGVGHFVHDSGSYYACTASGCTELQPQPATDSSVRVSNPVPFLQSGDNNGVVLQMPAVPSGGAGITYGTLSLGVGTQSDNDVTGFSVIPADAGGNLTVSMSLNGSTYSYPGSFLDSGSNFYFAPLSGVVPVDSSGHFVPPTPLDLPITLSASAGAAYAASLGTHMLIGNYAAMDFSQYVAFDNIGVANGAPTPVTPGTIFDLGMPYFYGRSVAYVINNMSSPLGSGPLYAIH